MDGLDPEIHGEPAIKLAAVMEEIAANNDRVALLARLHASKPPTAEGRSLLRATLMRHADKLDCAHVAVEDVGFMAAAQRAALSALAILGMRKVEFHLHATLTDARAAFDVQAKPSPSLIDSIEMFFAAPSKTASAV